MVPVLTMVSPFRYAAVQHTEKVIPSFFASGMRIPAKSGHRFRSNPATCSNRKRPLIPIQSGHFFGNFRNWGPD